MNMVKIIDANSEEYYVNKDSISMIYPDKCFTNDKNEKCLGLFFYTSGAAVFKIVANNATLRQLNSLIGTEFKLLGDE